MSIGKIYEIALMKNNSYVNSRVYLRLWESCSGFSTYESYSVSNRNGNCLLKGVIYPDRLASERVAQWVWA